MKRESVCKNCGNPISKVEGFSYECAAYPHAEPSR